MEKTPQKMSQNIFTTQPKYFINFCHKIVNFILFNNEIWIQVFDFQYFNKIGFIIDSLIVYGASINKSLLFCPFHFMANKVKYNINKLIFINTRVKLSILLFAGPVHAIGIIDQFYISVGIKGNQTAFSAQFNKLIQNHHITFLL